MHILARFRHQLDLNPNITRLCLLVYGCGLWVHLALASGFLYLQEPVSMVICLAGAIFYLVLVYVASFGPSGNPVYIFSFVEVLLLTTLFTLIYGAHYGFFLYNLAIIPVYYYLTSQDETVSRPLVGAVILGATDLGITGLTAGLTFTGGIKAHPVAGPVFFVGNLILSLQIILITTHLYISDEKLTSRHLNHRARYDNLTGLRNRFGVAEDVTLALEDRRDFCVVMCDIDDFKVVNDTYGHDIGDEVLKLLSQVLTFSLRKDDIICRWGGEEFLIVIMNSLPVTLMALERIRSNLAVKSVITEGSELYVTLTFGVARREEATSFDELMSLADSRLYTGKRSGKNCIVS